MLTGNLEQEKGRTDRERGEENESVTPVHYNRNFVEGYRNAGSGEQILERKGIALPYEGVLSLLFYLIIKLTDSD